MSWFIAFVKITLYHLGEEKKICLQQLLETWEYLLLFIMKYGYVKNKCHTGTSGAEEQMNIFESVCPEWGKSVSLLLFIFFLVAF